MARGEYASPMESDSVGDWEGEGKEERRVLWERAAYTRFNSRAISRASSRLLTSSLR